MTSIPTPASPRTAAQMIRYVTAPEQDIMVGLIHLTLQGLIEERGLTGVEIKRGERYPDRLLITDPQKRLIARIIVRNPDDHPEPIKINFIDEALPHPETFRSDGPGLRLMCRAFLAFVVSRALVS